ncbi:Sperm associated antigen 1 [Sorochytrium milnesiophthora]
MAATASSDFAALRKLTEPHLGAPGGGSESAVPEDYDIDHFDYAYVETCSDLVELKQILAVLKSASISGKEGLYPDLEQAVERRIAQINGQTHDWLRDMDETAAPVARASSHSARTATNTTTQRTSDKIKASDYHAWDSIGATDLPQSGPKDVPTTVHINPHWTEKQVEAAAERENIKGNEAFKTKDYAEAIVYYTRAINVRALPKHFGNRCLAHLKLQKYHDCINDASAALDMHPETLMQFKCHFRRGMARFKTGKYEEAFDDYRTCEELCPNDPGLAQQRQECEQHWIRTDLPRYQRYKQTGTSRKMVIEELEDDGEPASESKIVELPDDDPPKEQQDLLRPVATRRLKQQPTGKKIKVAIVQDDEDEDD